MEATPLTTPVETALEKEFVTCLWSQSPDIHRLQQRLEHDLGLSSENVKRLIYQITLKANATVFPSVTKLELIHTEGCNLACTYCFEKTMLGYRRMSEHNARAAIDLLFDYSGEQKNLTITHFGGEPTLNMTGVKAATEYAEEKAAHCGKTVEFHMTSNGILINETMTKYFETHGIRVLLSIDGLAPTHNRYRRDKRGNGTFDRVILAMRLLKQRQGWIGVKITSMPQNADRLFEDVVGLYNMGVNQFVIGHATGVLWSEQEMQCYVDQLKRVYNWYKKSNRSDLRIAEFDEEPINESYFGCQAGRDSMTATVDGEISPCAKILAMENKKLLAKLGDVQYGLTHLQNRSELNTCNKLRTACEERAMDHEFQGGCFASNYEGTGDLFRPNILDHQFSLMQKSVCTGCTSKNH